MIKVTLVGQGNVSHHLAKVFQLSEDVELVAVLDSRKTVPKNLMEQTEICIIAVSDGAIKEVSQRIKAGNCLVAHTSGSVALDELPLDFRRGVFYPLQTFSKDKEIDFSNIPICIEAEKEKDALLLTTLAKCISKNVQTVSSSQRLSLHLAAVFANNFPNHLYQIANEICIENELSFDLLKPLIIETSDKINTLSPFEAQTGPARREDSTTMQEHIDLLKNSDRKEIYSQLSKSIQKTYGKEL